MKKLMLLCFVLLSNLCFSQITSSKSDGGSVVTNLSMGIKVNKNSTLMRDYIVLNDAKCPIQLNSGFGITTTYLQKYTFNAVGEFTASETVLAYEIHSVLYNIFGEHIKTLSSTNVEDVPAGQKQVSGQWYASENQVSEYLFCVSYVAKVRKANGTLWIYSPIKIKEELSKIAILYEESYIPKVNNN